jgi:hypothetical protein
MTNRIRAAIAVATAPALGVALEDMRTRPPGHLTLPGSAVSPNDQEQPALGAATLRPPTPSSVGRDVSPCSSWLHVGLSSAARSSPFVHSSTRLSWVDPP